jgi:mannose-6-phosphate isomerase-like protein (cupin superfamily)
MQPMPPVIRKRNITQVMDSVAELWSPHVLGEVNDYDVKVANVAGEYVEHVHAETDEIFVVLSGRLWLDLPDGTVQLGPMDVLTVPRGVAHRPRAADGTRILMVEPRGTSRDGAGGSTGVRPGD